MVLHIEWQSRGLQTFDLLYFFGEYGTAKKTQR
jgi:hypothetical protein